MTRLIRLFPSMSNTSPGMISWQMRSKSHRNGRLVASTSRVRYCPNALNNCLPNPKVSSFIKRPVLYLHYRLFYARVKRLRRGNYVVLRFATVLWLLAVGGDHR